MKKTIHQIARALPCFFLKDSISFLYPNKKQKERNAGFQKEYSNNLQLIAALSKSERRLQHLLRKMLKPAGLTGIALIYQLGLLSNVRAQEVNQDNALKIGDRVPKNFWTVKHQVYREGKVKQEDLSALKGKIIIVDFWASWCTNCIYKFPKVDSLNRIYKDIAAVLLVNAKGSGDKIENINKVYKGLNGAGKSFALASIIQDTLINKLLPHTFLPQYMWIDRDGRLIAITNSDFVNEKNILSISAAASRLDEIRKKRKEELQ